MNHGRRLGVVSDRQRQTGKRKEKVCSPFNSPAFFSWVICFRIFPSPLPFSQDRIGFRSRSGKNCFFKPATWTEIEVEQRKKVFLPPCHGRSFVPRSRFSSSSDPAIEISSFASNKRPIVCVPLSFSLGLSLSRAGSGLRSERKAREVPDKGQSMEK